MNPKQQLVDSVSALAGGEIAENYDGMDEILFLSDARIAYWEWDRGDGQPVWSRQIYRMLDIQQYDQPLTVERYCEYVTALYVRQVRALFLALTEGNADVPVAVVHALISPEGAERLVVLRADVMVGEGGRPLRYAGSIEQLAERSGRDARFHPIRLLDAQRRFEQAFQHTLTPCLIVSHSEGRIVRANRACLRLFGMPIEDLLGRSTLELGFWKDGSQWREFASAIARQGLASGTDACIQTAAGILYIVLSGYGIDWLGERYIVLELQDVTARRRFEASFYLGAIPTGISSLEDSTFIEVNDAYLDLLGYTREQIIGKSCMELGVWQSPEAWGKVLDALQREGSVRNVEATLVRRDGEIREVLFFAQAVELQEQSCFLSQVRDITERKRAERKLRLAAATLEHLGEALLISDAQGYVISINPAFTRMTGYSWKDVSGRTLQELLAQPSMQHDTPPFLHMMKTAVQSRVWEGEVWTRRKNGEIFPQRLSLSTVQDASGNTLNYIAVLSDITQHKEYEAQLKYIAYHDALTSLPNRKLFSERCQQAILRAQRAGGECAVLYLDLDRFKPINDTYGHEVGDKLLQQVALRMQHCVRATDTVARLGGDEFVVLLDGLGSRQNAVTVAQKMVTDLAQPFQLNGGTLLVSASIGIAVWPEHGSDEDVLLRKADKALYAAKQSGRNQYSLADSHD